MKKKDLKIVFMGTPEFAVESLRILVENNYNIAGVVTMPDKPAGRGHKIQYSAVKQYALENNLPLLQPEKLKDNDFLQALKEWKADLQIVVAFRMLPEVVWNMPRYGTFNLHASLLPQYRGAAPINWAIINGEKETGVTTFFLTHEIDTGKIILQEHIQIEDTDNAGNVHDKLMYAGSHLVRKTVDLILEDKINTVHQEELIKRITELKAAPKIFKETCKINWNQPGESIYNFVRGLSPYPAAWTELHRQGKEPVLAKVLSVSIKEGNEGGYPPGTIVTDNKSYLKIVAKDSFVCINEIKLAGKKTMKTEELLKGCKFTQGDYFK